MPQVSKNCQLTKKKKSFELKWQYVGNKTTQIICSVSLTASHVAYASTNKTQIVRIKTELFFSQPPPPPPPPHFFFFFLNPVWPCLMFTCVLGRYVAASLISTQTFRRALTLSVNSCAEIKIECPISGIISSGGVWRMVPESEARSVPRIFTVYRMS